MIHTRPVRLLGACGVLFVLLWVAIPAARALQLLRVGNSQVHPSAAGLPVEAIAFQATDHVLLRGWLVRSSPDVPTIVLIAGFKENRTSMLPYARFLHAAGLNVLLYDSRGTGGSGGSFSLGLREVDDVAGAIKYLWRRRDLPRHQYGLLGVSLGAGVAIVAAAHLPSVQATIADSAYVDQTALVDRLNSLRLGPIDLPLAPIGPRIVDRMLGAPIRSFKPIDAVSRIAPRALLLIHSRHDTNPTTPLRGALQLLNAARKPAYLWIAPRGGHAGALAAQPQEYRDRAIVFFRRFLGGTKHR